MNYIVTCLNDEGERVLARSSFQRSVFSTLQQAENYADTIAASREAQVQMISDPLEIDDSVLFEGESCPYCGQEWTGTL